MDNAWREIRHAVRRLIRKPGFTLPAIVTLALGIGANCSIFSAINAFLLRPLPFEQPDELVHLFQVDSQRGWNQMRFALPTYHELERQQREQQSGPFTKLGAYDYQSQNLSGDDDEPQGIIVGRLSASALDTLGVQPAIGSAFRDQHFASAEPVVLLDHGLWQRRYSGSPQMVGQTVRIDGVAHTVIGVMKADFQFPYPDVKAWVPLPRDVEQYSYENRRFQIFGRLDPNLSASQARTQLQVIHATIQSENPSLKIRDHQLGVRMVPLRRALLFSFDIMQSLGWLLMAAVFLILLIACFNVANLLLAQAASRRTEMALRAALGAGRVPILRQLLIESIVLAVLGGAVGLFVADGMLRLLKPSLPETLYRVGQLGVDRDVLIFAALLSLVTALVFGLAPAREGIKANPATTLKQGGPALSGGSRRFGRFLVVAQLTLAVVLLSGAMTLLRTFVAFQNIDPGLDANGVLTTAVTLSAGDYPDDERRNIFYRRALDGVRSLPGVTAAAAVYPLPMDFDVRTRRIAVDDHPSETTLSAEVTIVTPDYFAALGVPRLRGRGFAAGDRIDSQPVVVINELMARRLWSLDEAVGKTVRLQNTSTEDSRLQVVGVVGNVRNVLSEQTRMQIYLPMEQGATRSSYFVVRSANGSEVAAALVQDTVWAIDRNLPVAKIRSMAAVAAQSLAPWRVTGSLLGGLAAGALALAGVGLSGLVAFMVMRRRRELAIRLAMGASREDVLGLVLRDGLRLAIIGLLVGIPVAWLSTWLASRWVPGLTSAGIVALVGIPVLLAGVAALATYLPARQALRINPAELLRVD